MGAKLGEDQPRVSCLLQASVRKKEGGTVDGVRKAMMKEEKECWEIKKREGKMKEDRLLVKVEVVERGSEIVGPGRALAWTRGYFGHCDDTEHAPSVQFYYVHVPRLAHGPATYAGGFHKQNYKNRISNTRAGACATTTCQGDHLWRMTQSI